MWSTRIRARLAGALALTIALLPATPLSAAPAPLPATPLSAAPAPLPAPTNAACAVYGGVRICSGQVPSFDGTPLDADLSFPTTGSGAARSHPLIVLLHGFGNDKHEWESTTDQADNADKWHWNSHWFATHGYYVLAYTARGFSTAPAQSYEPATPAGSSRLTSPSATIHLKSREFEVRDTQWLAALAAMALPDLDRGRVAVSGGSYGGGESWLLASQAEWTFPHSVVTALPVLNLQVAVPKYPWTDLAYSLFPNGHGGGPSGADLYESAQGQPTTGLGNPIGIDKFSYSNALFAIGNSSGTFEQGTTTTPSSEGPINLVTWFGRMVDVGEPYETPSGQDADPIVVQIRRGLTLFRGSYYQLQNWQAQVGRREVAVFSVSGWTDDLFPPVESFRQFKELKRLDPLWPVEVGVSDIGHPRAQNPAAVWHVLNERAWRFLSNQIAGSHQQQTMVFSIPTQCTPDASALSGEVSATTPESLGAGELLVNYAAAQTLTSDGGLADPNGPATDPLVHAPPFPSGGGGCVVSPGPAVGGFSGVSAPLASAVTYVGLGYAEVPYVFTGLTGQLDARVWDVAPSGQTLLVSHGTYRLEVPAFDAPAGTLRLPLFGNHWRLEAGHQVRLDLTQVDQPFLRPSNVASTLTFDNPRLVLPTREPSDLSVPGS
jgi:dienelactone hydrolase